MLVKFSSEFDRSFKHYLLTRDFIGKHGMNTWTASASQNELMGGRGGGAKFVMFLHMYNG